ncbi:MAG TPA: heavy metal translocating P-type ATPase [Acidimicrobiales bacterium]|nr:heavy metal translocating P-type ATPase [Acidimicrobiales bacterium]
MVAHVAARSRRRPRRVTVDWALFVACSTGLVAGLGLALAGAGRAAEVVWSLSATVALVAVLVATAVALRERRVGVDVLAALALGGVVAIGEYAAAAVIALMVATGRLLESWAASRAEADLRRLLAHAPQVVHRYGAGGIDSPPLESVTGGDLLLVKPGEIVPVDGRLESETAVLDLSSLTGESVPVTASRNELVESGAVNAGGPFDLRAISTAAESTFAGIVRLVSSAIADRPPFVRMADRYAAAFVPFSLLLCGVAWAASGTAERAVAVLVVATPCPLILAAPIALVAGLSRTARSGVIVKGGGVLERLATATVLVFDKTGTVTRGEPVVSEVVPAPGRGSDEVLRLAAGLEQTSPHVLASAIVRAGSERGLELPWPENVSEVLGKGAAGTVDGHVVRVGRGEWLAAGRLPWTRRVRRRAEMDSSMTVYAEVDGELAGVLLLEDPLRPDAARSIRELRAAGISRIVMASGDRQAVAESVGAVVGVDQVLAERSPADKVESVRLERQRGTTVMVGDGVNDAPALAVADVGIALGARGASASSETADVVVTLDRIDPIVAALKTARRSRRIALESVTVGMGLSVAAMGVAAAGLLAPLPGAITQEAIDVVVILNALRALLAPRQSATISPGEAALGHLMAEDHERLRPHLAEIRSIADELEELEPAEARSRLAALERFLVNDLLPHERREQEDFYPVVARLLGGRDPVGAMSRTHVEIDHLVAMLGRLVHDLGPGGPDDEERRELRRILYGLHAVLILHFAQEDEGYLSMVPEEPALEAQRDAPALAVPGAQGRRVSRVTKE